MIGNGNCNSNDDGNGKGRLTLPKRMNFQKSSKRPLIYGKLYCKFFKLATKPSKVAGTLYFLKAWVREHQQKIVAFSQGSSQNKFSVKVGILAQPA